MSALDRKTFGAAIKARIHADGHTTTSGAEAAGVSRSQFWRGINAQSIDAGAFLALCRWLGVDPFSFLLGAGVPAPRETIPPSMRPEFRVWMNMIRRCTDPDTTRFDRYGGRGITVCERWSGDFGFEAFYEDMGQRPSASHTIDRIENDGNYEPGNCRWATKKEQNRNKSDNHRVEYGGRTVAVSEAVEIAGSVVKASLASRRIRNGWPVAKAVETPVHIEGRSASAP